MAKIVHPPGPKGHFLVGNFPFGRPNPLPVLDQCAHQYGDIFYYRSFFVHVYFLNHPDLIGQVLVRDYQKFKKGRGLQANRDLFGQGLLTSEGQFWRRQRRLMQPAFRRDRIAGYAHVVVESALQLLQGWQSNQVRNLQTELSDLTLRIVCKCLFGQHVCGRTQVVGEGLGAVMRFNTRGRVLLPLAGKLPTPAYVKYRRAIRRLDAFIYGLIESRRRHPNGSFDLLNLLLEARDEKGRGHVGAAIARRGDHLNSCRPRNHCAGA